MNSLNGIERYIVESLYFFLYLILNRNYVAS